MRKNVRRISILIALIAFIVLIEVRTGILSACTVGQLQLAQPLMQAGMNRYELVAALRAVPRAHRKAMIFLIDNMPERDLKTLKKEFLVENLELAYKVRKEVPWGDDIPEEIFLNYVVPYAVITENRENCRADLYKRFIGTAKNCSSAEEAVIKLNTEVFNTFNVHYKPHMHKMAQSPSESIAKHSAACTGLAILFISTCRSVGIPARLSSTQWADIDSWHNWTEVWDHQWRFISAGDITEIDAPWVAKHALNAIPHDKKHGIYAVSFQRTDTVFPVPWAPTIDYLNAVETTCFYTKRRKVKVNLIGKQVDENKKLRTVVFRDGEIVAARDIVNSTEFILAAEEYYDVVVSSLDGQQLIKQHVRIYDKPNPRIQLSIN